MKQTFKKILLSIPGFQKLCRLFTRKHVRTLMYHRFSEIENGNPRFISKELLRSQVEYIIRYHTCWTPSEHLAALEQHGKWKSCPVVITVDDGYRDFYEVAYPVFRQAGIPAMLFVTTGFVDCDLLLWWDRLEIIIERGKGRVISIEVEGKLIEIDLTTEESRTRIWNIVADCCRFLPHGEKELLLEKLATAFEVDYFDISDVRFRAVSWEEVRTMSDSGILIGAHTLTHPILSRLDSANAKIQIEESGKRLEEMGIPVDWFCYPQGGPADYTHETYEIVKAAGFKGSYIAYQSLDHQNDRFALPRYCISNDQVDFEWCLCGAEYLVLKINKMIGKPEAFGEYYWQGSQGINEAFRAMDMEKTN